MAGLGWWNDSMTIRPAEATLLSVTIRLSAVCESKPDVGSSSTTIEGSITSSIPIVTRLRSPPDTPRMPEDPPTCEEAT